MYGYFRVLCVGYGLYAVGNTMLLLLLYFTDYKGAVACTAVFALTATGLTAVSLSFSQVHFGFGFLAGGAAFFLAALTRLRYFTARLPYYILSRQPMVQEDKTGRFTRLEHLLEKGE